MIKGKKKESGIGIEIGKRNFVVDIVVVVVAELEGK